jgi:hypothetical protein
LRLGLIQASTRYRRRDALRFPALQPYPETGRELLAEGTAPLVAIGPDWRAKELPQRIKAALSQGK